MLVNDLSTLTLLEGGTLRLRREPIDVDVLVNETLDAFRPEAAAAGVQLTEAVDPNLPALDADPARIRGVLGNLVSNALAHSKSRREHPGRGSRHRRHGYGSPFVTTVRAFPPTCCRASSIASSRGRVHRFRTRPRHRRDVVEAHGGTVEATSSPATGTAIMPQLPVATAGSTSLP